MRILLLGNAGDEWSGVPGMLAQELPGVETEQIHDSQAFASALSNGECAAVITEHLLGWTNGIQILETVKAHWSDCPVIFFTSSGHQGVAVKAMRAGAEDYVLKNQADRLPYAVRHAIERASIKRRCAEAARQQHALYHFIERRHRAKSLEEIYEAALDTILSAVRCDRASILVRDESGAMRFVAWRGLSENYRKSLEGHSPWQDGDSSPQPVCVPDVSAAQIDDRLKALVAREGIGGLAFIPLVMGDRLAGKFMTYYDACHVFTPDEIELSLTIARQIALGIERAWTEQCLRESEQRFRYMADAAPVMIWITGRNGVATWFNKQWLEFVGRPIEQAIGNGWTENVHSEDYASYLQTFSSSFDARQPFSMMYRLRRHDGEYRWVLDNGGPQYGPNGDFTGYIGSAIDITDRKKIEEALKEADRRKDEFLAMLGHELRNPLGIISNSTRLLNSIGPQESQLQEWREIIGRQVDHMGRMLDDLLDVSRISRGKVQLQGDRCDLTAIVTQAVDDYRSVLLDGGLKLVLELPDASVWVTGDETRLAQALSSLLNNANKFSEPGGTVAVRLVQEDTTALISIQDSGIGIEPEMLQWIFEPFSQADKTLHRSAGGLGLGLSLVKGIVELHGGSIEAHSGGAGQGALFIVRIPLAPIETAVVVDSAPHEKKHLRFRILVIEDNPLAARSTCLLLEQSGHTVEVAENGPAGIEAAQKFRPEVVLCDIGLPGFDGYAVADLLRRQLAFRGIYLVGVSGYAQDEKRTRDCGFDAYLTKPVDFDELEKILAESVGRHSASA